MPLPFTARSLDPDAADFCARSGASDRAALSAFVRGVKDLGLWESMVAWPLRSSQNAGYGDTVYSLGGLGTYDGTRVNAPAWGTSGVTFTNAGGQYITTNLSVGSVSTPNATVFWVGSTASFSTNRRLIGSSSSSSYISLTGSTTGSFRVIEAVAQGSIHVNTVTQINQTLALALVSVFGSGVSGFLNGNFLAADSALSDGFATANLTINSSFNPSDATCSAAIFLPLALSASQVAAVNTLYKQTLGTGLGLP